jgi:hypothetical protein
MQSFSHTNGGENQGCGIERHRLSLRSERDIGTRPYMAADFRMQ